MQAQGDVPLLGSSYQRNCTRHTRQNPFRNRTAFIQQGGQFYSLFLKMRVECPSTSRLGMLNTRMPPELLVVVLP